LLPKSALAQATTYALNQWQALCCYTQDGRLTINNNVSERRLRDQAIGRKNWMFLGSVLARRDLAAFGGRESGVVGQATARALGPDAPGARPDPSP
jgi:hypothetical protein